MTTRIEGPPGAELRAVHKRIGQRRVLRDVSFAARSGRLTVLLGHNGSGKSASLSVLLGLARVDRGSALLAGRPLAEHRDPRRVVGAVLDRPTASAGRTARNHLRIVVGQGIVQDREVADALEHAGLAAVADDRVGSYSLGMRQRLAVAGALLHRPATLVMDEPHNGLDASGTAWLHRSLTDHVDGGGSALLATHRIREALQLADDVIVLNSGQVAYTGPATGFLLRDRVVVDLADEQDAGPAMDALTDTGLEVVKRDGSQLVVTGGSTARVAVAVGGLGLRLRGINEQEPGLADLVPPGRASVGSAPRGSK